MNFLLVRSRRSNLHLSYILRRSFNDVVISVLKQEEPPQKTQIVLALCSMLISNCTQFLSVLKIKKNPIWTKSWSLLIFSVEKFNLIDPQKMSFWSIVPQNLSWSLRNSFLSSWFVQQDFLSSLVSQRRVKRRLAITNFPSSPTFSV